MECSWPRGDADTLIAPCCPVHGISLFALATEVTGPGDTQSKGRVEFPVHYCQGPRGERGQRAGLLRGHFLCRPWPPVQAHPLGSRSPGLSPGGAGGPGQWLRFLVHRAVPGPERGCLSEAAARGPPVWGRWHSPCPCGALAACPFRLPPGQLTGSCESSIRHGPRSVWGVPPHRPSRLGPGWGWGVAGLSEGVGRRGRSRGSQCTSLVSWSQGPWWGHAGVGI